MAVVVVVPPPDRGRKAQNTSTQIGARKGPVAKLVELERRKNEWLRQRFGR